MQLAINVRIQSYQAIKYAQIKTKFKKNKAKMDPAQSMMIVHAHARVSIDLQISPICVKARCMARRNWRPTTSTISEEVALGEMVSVRPPPNRASVSTVNRDGLCDPRSDD
jgi:hypothetical protein